MKRKKESNSEIQRQMKRDTERETKTEKETKSVRKREREGEVRESELTVNFNEGNCDEAAAVHLDQQMTDHISAGHLSPAAV